MTAAVTANNGVGGSALSDRTGSMGLDQSDFLRLLTAQLQNQDPLSPLDNSAFVAQLAQFSTVSGITEMNSSLESIASQMLSGSKASAPQWIGRTVTDNLGVSATVSGVVFDKDGTASLQLDSGRSLSPSDITAVS